METEMNGAASTRTGEVVMQRGIFRAIFGQPRPRGLDPAGASYVG